MWASSCQLLRVAKGSSREVEHVFGLHYRDPRVVMLKVEIHYGYSYNDQRVF